MPEFYFLLTSHLFYRPSENSIVRHYLILDITDPRHCLLATTCLTRRSKISVEFYSQILSDSVDRFSGFLGVNCRFYRDGV